MEAFSNPSLKKEIEKLRKQYEIAHLSSEHLEEKLQEERINNIKLEEKLEATVTQCKCNIPTSISMSMITRYFYYFPANYIIILISITEYFPVNQIFLLFPRILYY